MLGIIIVFLLNIVSAVCCERTDDGGKCIDVIDRNNCNDASPFRIDDTACESTSYCKPGICVNILEGTCGTSSSSACNPGLGGYWTETGSADAESYCQVGCCLIREGATLVERIRCSAMASDEGVLPDFREGVTTLDECLPLAGMKEEGACVFQTDRGKECTRTIQEECAEGREFHAGLLCSAPQLGTTCTMTERTSCFYEDEGLSEVYFVDNCNQRANVYNSVLQGDIDYWTNIIDSNSNAVCGYGLSNAKSPSCGNCNPEAGSICSLARGTGVTPTFGEFICKDMNCAYKGVKKEHGEAWCSQPIDYFQHAKPGDVSYRLSCYNGEVGWEPCGNNREGLCKGDSLGNAFCLPNRGQDCLFQNNSKDCLNLDKRDCKIYEGVSRKNESGDDILFLRYTTTYAEDGTIASESADYIKATCVANYTLGFNFWDSATEGITPTEVCTAGSVSSSAGYHKAVYDLSWWAREGKCFAKCIEGCSTNVVGKPECEQLCFDKCPASESFLNKVKEGVGLNVVDLNPGWATSQENFCVAMGDCGVKANYIDGNSYYSWKELFMGIPEGNVSKSSIPGANNYK